MRRLVGKRLPRFTREQSQLVIGSLDFLGVNYYTSNFAANAHFHNGPNNSYTTDNQVNLTTERNGLAIGEAVLIRVLSHFTNSFYDVQEGVPLYVYPQGLRDVLVYTKNKYGNPTIYITENGFGETNITKVEGGVKDLQRARFYQAHLRAVKEAIGNGVNVKGFFPWTFMDDWEWNSGFTERFGLVFVDFKNGLKRYPKSSALWFKKFLQS
ncbi:unnamed protein product [Coffea canephora]|uniref:Beta-glucosidase n=1 Tax=Coffea canephora TaxID=49390 RepID=A0A068UH01_COFCA|nr:unnamed protein product [Coffea canephora]